MLRKLNNFIIGCVKTLIGLVVIVQVLITLAVIFLPMLFILAFEEGER